MPDIVGVETRSRMMSGIRGHDTKPELAVRRWLHAHGFRYRLHVRELPGKPDVVLPRYRTVVFVHGCFWHRHRGCRYASTPSSNRAFWADKLTRNAVRDAEQGAALSAAGWRVLVVWECETTNEAALGALSDSIRQPRTSTP